MRCIVCASMLQTTNCAPALLSSHIPAPVHRPDWQQPRVPRVAAVRRNNGEHRGRAQPLAETVTVTKALALPSWL